MNELDWELGKILAERSIVVEAIHRLKKHDKFPPRDRAQEQNVIKSVVGSHRRHEGKYSEETLKRATQAIIDGHEEIASSIQGSFDEGDRKGSRD